MASYRLFTTFVNRTFCRNVTSMMKPTEFSMTPARGMRQGWSVRERMMKHRRKLAGPDRLRRRSEWLEWDYKAELHAFPIRLNETISEDTLRTVFTNQSYIDAEQRKRNELGVQGVALNLIPNTELAHEGNKILHAYVKGFIRHCYRELPEEGVQAVFEYLTAEELLAHVSSNIGTTELILSEDFPVSTSTLSTTFKAIIGAVARDQTQERAELFVLDFVCTQLIGKDVMEIWDVQNPLHVVNSLLKKHGHGPTESRLIFESGRNTLEAIYVVGLYSDKVFLGQSPGETIAVAEDLAAIDVLRKLFKTTSTEKALPLGKEGRSLKFSCESMNLCLSDWYNPKFAEKTLALTG